MSERVACRVLHDHVRLSAHQVSVLLQPGSGLAHVRAPEKTLALPGRALHGRGRVAQLRVPDELANRHLGALAESCGANPGGVALAGLGRSDVLAVHALLPAPGEI